MRQARANLGRRNGQRHGIQPMNARALRRRIRVTGPRYHNKFGVANQVPPAMPTGDFGEGVGANDKERFFSHASNFLHGIDGVALLRSGLKTRRLKTGIHAAGQLQHAEPVFVAGHHLIGFVGRMRGRNKPNLVEMKLIGGLARHDQMSVVDRIECSAEECQPHPKGRVS